MTPSMEVKEDFMEVKEDFIEINSGGTPPVDQELALDDLKALLDLAFFKVFPYPSGFD